MKALNAQRRADRPRGAEARRRKSGWIPASFLSILVALAGGLGSPRAATAADGTWTNTATGGLWSDWLNWLDSFVAGDAGFTADFNTLDLAEDVTVHLDAPVTIGSLTLGDTDTNTAAGWILDNNGDATNILTLAGASNANTITVNALGAGKTATISAEITGTANPGLIKKGAGILVLSATNTYTGATRISNGVVRADYGVGVPTAGNLNLAGGVLEIAQDLTAAYGTAAGQVQWTASGAGFSAFGSATVTVDCGSTPRSYPQQTGELVLNGARANQDLIFRTPLTYTARGYVRVASPSNGATMTGKWKIQGSSVHSGKFGAGTLTLQGGWDVDGAGGTDPNVYEGRLTMDNCNIQWTGANISDFNLSRPMPAPYAAAKEKAVLELRGSATLYGKYAAGGGGISMGSTNASDVELNGGTAIVSRIYRTGSQRTSMVYFDGGTVIALTNAYAGAFMTGPDGIYVRSGGATVDDAGFTGITAREFLEDPLSTGGGLKKIGAGSLILTGDSTYTGGTTIHEGSLQLGTGSNLSGSVLGPITDHTALVIANPGAAALPGVISGTGTLTKIGAGVATLSATNVYSGDTTIAAGTLALGALGALAGTPTILVASGAVFDVSAASPHTLALGQTLKGDGTVIGSLTAAGTVSPGTSLGLLSFSSDLTCDATAVVLMDIDPLGVPRSNDQIVVAGVLTYGGSLVVTNAGVVWPFVGESYPLFTAASYGGWFSSVTLPPLDPGFAWDTNWLATVGALEVYDFVCATQTLTATKNTATNVPVANVLAGAISTRGTAALATVDVVSAMSGSVAWVGGDLVYTPSAGFVGEDYFGCVVEDGHGSITGTVRVTVTDGGTPPPTAGGGMKLMGLSGGQLVLGFTGTVGAAYVLQTATNWFIPEPPFWFDLATNIAAAPDGLILTTNIVSTNQFQYYRTVAP